MGVTQSRSRRSRRESILLPEELIDDILVRLPVKSIIRFESVSKEWNSKFHSPSFRELFELHNNKKSESSPSLNVVHTIKLKDLFKMAPPLAYKIEDRSFSPPPKLAVIGPLSNGIYCLTSVPVEPDDEYNRIWEEYVRIRDTKIALFNPAIRQFKLLPPLPSRFCNRLPRIPSLLCRFVSGFAKLPSSSDYNVVVVINYMGNFLFFFYSGEWEMLDYKPEMRITNLIEPKEVCSQRLLNGCWHWMVEREDEHDNQYLCVLSFNFARKSFNLIAGPPDIGSFVEGMEADVILLHDHLASICTRQEDGGVYEVSVYMMMDYSVEESWTKIFSVDPRCDWDYSSLYRIDYTVVQGDGSGEEGGSDNIFIEKLFFSNSTWYSNELICANHHTGHQLVTLLYDTREEISLNTGGISSYKGTLDRLC